MTPWDYIKSRCAPGNASECWVWAGAKTPTGYGNFSFGGKRLYVHRASFEANVSPLKKGECVMHTCDNPSCFNPFHLKAGTQAENMRDMDAKRRRVLPDEHGMRKLSRLQVETIREFYATGRWLQQELADKFGVSRSYISELCGKRAARLWRSPDAVPQQKRRSEPRSASPRKRRGGSE